MVGIGAVDRDRRAEPARVESRSVTALSARPGSASCAVRQRVDFALRQVERTFASRASANMLMPMTIAAAAITPMTEKARRRIGSVRLPLIDEHRGQEQPEPDERREEDHDRAARRARG